MKHPFSTTLVLVALFVAAQLTGLALVAASIADVAVVDGEPALVHATTAIGDRPPLIGWQSALYLLVGVLLGTLLFLVLVKYRKFNLWKLWFLLAVFLAMSVAFGVVMPFPAAFALALALALLKIYRPNPWVHNATEVFMYAGIAVLLVPIFDTYWVLILLLAISAYDMIAVWKTKHMVSMANFQAESKVFAGLFVPRPGKKLPSPIPPKGKAPKGLKVPKPKGSGNAILGGGDIAFPLLFTGVVMEGLVLDDATKLAAFTQSLAVTLFASAALALLLFLAKKDRFYPAMPFLTAGCVVGWLVVLAL